MWLTFTGDYAIKQESQTSKFKEKIEEKLDLLRKDIVYKRSLKIFWNTINPSPHIFKLLVYEKTAFSALKSLLKL